MVSPRFKGRRILYIKPGDPRFENQNQNPKVQIVGGRRLTFQHWHLQTRKATEIIHRPSGILELGVGGMF